MRDARRGWIKATLWVGLAGAALVLWFELRGGVRLIPAPDAPQAPALVLRDLDGGELQLADFRGRVVVLNLWASWCAPCRVEIPRLVRLEREFAQRGLAVLGVNTEGLPAARLSEIVRELEIGYPVLVPGGPLQGAFAGKTAIPQTWLIDRRGRIRADHSGLASERSLRRACLELVEEPAP